MACSTGNECIAKGRPKDSRLQANYDVKVIPAEARDSKSSSPPWISPSTIACRYEIVPR
jgi:hypothetical protein